MQLQAWRRSRMESTAACWRMGPRARATQLLDVSAGVALTPSTPMQTAVPSVQDRMAAPLERTTATASETMALLGWPGTKKGAVARPSPRRPIRRPRHHHHHFPFRRLLHSFNLPLASVCSKATACARPTTRGVAPRPALQTANTATMRSARLRFSGLWCCKFISSAPNRVATGRL